MSQRIDKLPVARDASPHAVSAKGAEVSHSIQGTGQTLSGAAAGSGTITAAPSEAPYDFRLALRQLAEAKSMRRR